jgi:hypothetical protein
MRAPWLALAFAGLFGIAHLLALPMLMTFDGAEYVRLARSFGKDFFTAWDYARTPLYPAALRVSFWAFGTQPLATMLPNVLLAFGGTACLCRAALKTAGPWATAFGVVALALFPTAVAYQHTVLTETGAFFFLALLALTLTWTPQQRWRKTAALSACVAVAYYFRPTTLALAGLAALVYGLELWWGATEKRLKATAPALVVLLLPALFAVPWNRISAAYGGRDFLGQAMVFAMLKQALLPPDDPFLAEVRESYETAIALSSVDGSLDVGGLTRERHWMAYSTLVARAPEVRGVFWRAITEHPGRAATGVGRTLLLDLGVDSKDSENETYVKGVITDAETGAKLWIPAQMLPEDVDAALRVPGRSTTLDSVLGALHGPFDLVLGFGALVTLAGFVFALGRRHPGLLVLTATPLFWLSFHALLLIASDRMVVPSHALLVFNAFAVPAAVWRARPGVGANR